jgi:ribosome maturation factor RimP
MNDEKPLDKFREAAEYFVESAGYELVDLTVGSGNKGRSLQFFVDRPGGITVEECAALSLRLSRWIESEYPILAERRLDVSSPGLDRPLKSARDFRRHIDRNVRVELRDGDRTRELTGTVSSVTDDAVFLTVSGMPQTVPLASVVRAKIVLKW